MNHPSAAPMSCEYAHLDGAYLLGALAAAERAAYEGHLAGCKECARGVREFAGLPGLLAKVPAEVLEKNRDAQPASMSLLPTLVAEVRRDRRQRTAVAAAIAAATVVLLAGGSVAVVATLGDDGRPSAIVATTAPPRPMISLSEEVTGWISLTDVVWGTRLDLTCTYDDYDRSGSVGATTYAMYVRTTSGRSEQVATWRAVAGPMTIITSTAAAPDEIASVVVRTADGEPVLRLAP